MSNRIAIIDGRPTLVMNGKSRPRVELLDAMQAIERQPKTRLSIDAARSGTDLDSHWSFADAFAADTAYSKLVRHTLIKRSRYEATSNALYSGILKTYADLLIGTGPTLRMLTGSREFNQLAEREFYKWTQEIRLCEKLWTMCHARVQDGESFGVLQFDPSLRGDVKLNITLVEAEQCQSVYNADDPRRCDGIYYDEFDSPISYEFLPYHPGGSSTALFPTDTIKIDAADVIHWFKCHRPGQHRGIPALTSSLKVGAMSRRFREAIVSAAETAAAIGAILTATIGPNGEGSPDPIMAGTTVEWVQRMLVAAPYGWDAKQMKGEHPNAQYGEFCRLQAGEQGRPVGVPVNAVMGDSSTYSFASGKLDMLLFWRGADVDRNDCNYSVLDRLFAAWFREWTILVNRRDIPPAHQWDWPTHPIIDSVADANAKKTNLETGVLTHRQAFSDDGKDYEDQLAIMAEDWFGDASEENIAKCRKIMVLKSTPQHAIQYVANLLGVTAPAAQPQNTELPVNDNAQAV